MARLLWTLKQHVGPAPRALHAATFDTQRSRMILFGGDSLQGTLLRDTWEWDGDNWSQLNDIGPAKRSGAAMAYDAARGRTVLFGGLDTANPLGDTWEWDGEDWTQMADTGPSARAGHSMVFDSERNRTVLFGGISGVTLHGDTWEWEGNAWTQVEDVGPAPRQGHSMTYDSVRRRIVLFGGFSGAAALGDTWEFDGTTWTQTAAFGPPSTANGSFIYNGRRALLFGGASALTGSPVLFHLSWEWDGKHWTVRQDLGPGDRWGHTMVFDTNRNRGVLFGGATSLPNATPQSASGETWEQFEEGRPPEKPPVADVQVVALVVTPPQPVEGEPFSIEATLAVVPAPGATVEFNLIDAAGTDLFGGAVSVPVNNSTTVRFDSPPLPAGSYTVSAGSQSIQFQLTPNAVQLVSLAVNPQTVPAGASFSLTATLSAPALPPGVTLPLSIELPGTPPQVWGGQPLLIPAGQPSGTLTIDTQALNVTGSLTFNGSLGGGTAAATVTLA